MFGSFVRGPRAGAVRSTRTRLCYDDICARRGSRERIPIANVRSRKCTRIGHQSRTGRENIPVAGANRGRGERIYPWRAPIAEGERE
eukprot:8120699-Pyramimonas_sp.AAC.1